MGKVYLGDSVYADFNAIIRGDVILTTERGNGPTNSIYLGPQVIDALNQQRTSLGHNTRATPLPTEAAVKCVEFDYAKWIQELPEWLESLRDDDGTATFSRKVLDQTIEILRACIRVPTALRECNSCGHSDNVLVAAANCPNCGHGARFSGEGQHRCLFSAQGQVCGHKCEFATTATGAASEEKE